MRWVFSVPRDTSHHVHCVVIVAACSVPSCGCLLRCIEELLSLLSISLFDRPIANFWLLAWHDGTDEISLRRRHVVGRHELLFIWHAKTDTSINLTIIKLVTVSLLARHARTSSGYVLALVFLHTLEVSCDSCSLNEVSTLDSVLVAR